MSSDVVGAFVAPMLGMSGPPASSDDAWGQISSRDGRKPRRRGDYLGPHGTEAKIAPRQAMPREETHRLMRPDWAERGSGGG